MNEDPGAPTPAPAVEVVPAKKPISERKLAANRRNALKSGKYAKVLTPYEIAMTRLKRVNPRAPEILAAAKSAVLGDLEAWQEVQAGAMAEMEILRQVSIEIIKAQGMVVEDEVLDREGRLIGKRLQAHPLLDFTRRAHPILGHTAAEMQITRKSRGQGEKDAAIAQLARRAAMLRGAPKHRLPPPPEDAQPEGAIEVKAAAVR